MANITNMIDKIFTEYKNSNMIINSALKYRFSYNRYNTDVFYTQKDGLQNQLLLAITVDNVTYITTLYFYKKDKEYCMQFYLPNELYEQLQFSLLYVDGHCAVTPYFETMINYIMAHKPISVNHRNELANYHNYVYGDRNNNPYFKTTKRVSMSAKMRNKIKNKYDEDLATKILEFCGTTKTLVYTSNIAESKDIEAYMNAHSST